jgi:hypothetical protein
MIMREIDATPRAFGLVVNSGLLPIRTGSAVAANHVVGVQAQPVAELLTINLAQWGGGLRGWASYTDTYTEDTATGQGLSNSPEHLGRFELSLAIWQNKGFASVELQAMSECHKVEWSHFKPRLTSQRHLARPEDCQGTGRFRQQLLPLRPALSRPGILGFRAGLHPTGRRSFRIEATNKS